MKETKASIHEQSARKTAADRVKRRREPGNGFHLPARKELDTRPPPTTSPPEETGRHGLPKVLRQERRVPQVEPAKPITAAPKRRPAAALRLRSR